MRPNLSLEKFTAVLAALGASTVVACGAAQPQPVSATEVTPTTAAPASAPAPALVAPAAAPAPTNVAAAPAPAPAADPPAPVAAASSASKPAHTELFPPK